MINNVHNTGMGAFNRWTYNVNLNPLGISNVTMDTNYQNTGLIPNTSYIIDIFPFFPGTLGPVNDVNDELTSSWIVQTVDNGQCIVIVVIMP